VAPPAGGVWRVARTATLPFAPPSWAYADPDTGTFGGRFDDPSPLPDGRYRIIYAASTPAGAFAEVLAPFRPSLSLLSELESAGFARGALTSRVGSVPEAWRQMRGLDHVPLAPDMRMVDLAASGTLAWLRRQPHLANLAAQLGLPDIDLAAVMGPSRAFTQACAAAIHAVPDRAYAGIRYLSRHGADEGRECWAMFDDRIAFAGEPERTGIDRDHPDLVAVARLFHLTIG